jgi:SEC-C motif-containing protein
MVTTCPCGTGAAYDPCCGQFHSGAASAPTAELLMRSRYAAFALGDRAYLLRTWHPRTRPRTLDLHPDLRWVGLDVVGTHGGGLLDATGSVEFRAHYRQPGGVTGVQHENSSFVREGGRWLYVGPLLSR